MNTSTRTGRRRTRRFATALTAVGVTAGAAMASAGTADAAFLTTYLHPIINYGNGICEVRVGLDVAMSEADAHAFIAHPGEEASVKLYGDDEWYDNFVAYVPVDAPTWPQPWAGGYSVEFFSQLSCSTLNEDWGEDDIYARITFEDFRTGLTHRANSNVRHGHF